MNQQPPLEPIAPPRNNCYGALSLVVAVIALAVFVSGFAVAARAIQGRRRIRSIEAIKTQVLVTSPTVITASVMALTALGLGVVALVSRRSQQGLALAGLTTSLCLLLSMLMALTGVLASGPPQ